MGQPIGKAEGAAEAFADLTQSLDVSASPFQLPSLLFFPCWLLQSLVNKVQHQSLPVTLGPCKGSHLPRSQFVSVGI